MCYERLSRKTGEMNKKQNIIELTKCFFDMHWYHENGSEIPEWKFDYTWSGSVPYHDLGGVYALLGDNDEVVYIGLGASRGGYIKNMVSHDGC
jgi:hypothetical protein